MAELFFESPPRRRLGPGLAISALVLMIVAGVVTVALPLRCIPGLIGDVVCPPSGPSAALAKAPAAPSPAAASLGMTAPTLEPALLAARPSAYGLVAATFDQLHTDPATNAVATTPEPAAAKPRPAVNTQWVGAPTVRLVSTTIIHPGPTEIAPPATIEPVSDPAPGPVPLAVAAAEPATDTAPTVLDVAPPMSATATSAPIPAPPPVRVAEASGFPTVQPLEAPDSAAAPAPADTSAKGAQPKSGTMLVGGSGVTARSGPSRSKGRLFELGPGQKVKVLGDTRGWYHISDARGRDGWVYSDFLAKAP